MRISRFFVCSALLLLLCFALSAQEQAGHPNFTGIWKLDADRSALDSHPDSVTLYIHQNDPDFHLRRTEVQHGKSSAWGFHGRTDGKLLEQRNRDGVKRTQMYWQGPQLVLELRTNDKHGEQQFTVRYSLSDGGKTLTAHEMHADHETRWVFTRSG